VTRDEQLDVLKGLLARVRAGAIARGVELPRDHSREASMPTSVPRESAAPLSIELRDDSGVEPLVAAPPPAPPLAHRNGSGLTAFAETGAGTHAPLALVGAPASESATATALAPQTAATAAALAAPPGLVDADEDDDDEDLPRTAVSISFANDSPYASPQAPPLQPPPSRQPFDAAFEDEITATGDPAEIEAAVLASSGPQRAHIPTPPPTPAPITYVPTGAPPAPPTRVVTPVPPAPPTRVMPQSTAPVPQRLSSLPAVPLTLDDLDLDGLGTPEAAISVPPPRAASYLPPTRLSQPPAMAVRPPPPPAPYIPTPPPPAPYIPTPPPRRLTPPPRIPTPPPYVPAPPRLPTPTAPAYGATPPPPMMSASDAIELEDGDIVESSPSPAMADSGMHDSVMPGFAMPDPMATLPGSREPFAAGAFDPRGSSPDVDDEVPASQRQMRVEDRPIDDALEGISEPPPESGEVESQRYTKVAEEIEQTTEVRALASVDVVDRTALDLEGAPVASFTGKLASSARPSFGEILDSALDL
jgi:hypothetical protein